MNKKWECYEVDESKVKELAQKYNINEILAKILVNKNLTKKQDIDLFIQSYKKRFP